MRANSDAQLSGLVAKGARARFAAPAKASEGDASGIGTEKRLLGSVAGRALACAGLTPKEAAFRLGYTESSSVSDFVSGLTAPIFLAKFLADPDLRSAFIEALAELPGDGVTLEKQIKICGRRTA